MSNAQDRMTGWLTWAALGAALVLTASAEYDLARQVGYGKVVAAALPVALDAYVIAALRARRELLVTVAAAVAVNGLSHLVDTGHVGVNAYVVVGVSALAPLVLWRVHALTGHGQEVNTPAAEVNTPDPVSTPLVFTGSDQGEPMSSQVARALAERPVSVHGWAAYGAEVPPSKAAFTRAASAVNTPAATDLQASVLALLDAGHGVRETARRAGCSPAYVSKVRRESAASVG